MGSRNVLVTDWVRRNADRYLSDYAPKHALDALQHVLAARAALEVGEVEVAEFMYRGAQRLWRQMESEDPGHWREEIESTGRELKRMHADGHHNHH